MLLHQVLDEAAGDRAEAARRVGVRRTTMYRWIEAGLLDRPIETIQARYGALTAVSRARPFSESVTGARDSRVHCECAGGM